jgi:uncharacterized protein with ParB-like and HNH nuclease domain
MNTQDFAENTPEELTETGEKSGVAQEIIDSQIPQEPFNPKEIAITPKIVPLETVVRRLRQETINLAPNFQRKAVWTPKQKSLLIESLMLNIPIPMFYVSADQKGNWEVVDGQQRLTAIKEFVLKKSLHLSELEFWKEFNGKDIDGLPPLPYNTIMETQLQFVIIEPSTPESVKYTIFKRINTGGLPLSNHEIRNALYQGEGTELLVTLSQSEQFLKATDNSIDDSRMNAQEIILRCLSFIMLGNEGYTDKDNMEDFLRRCLQILNHLDDLSNKTLVKEYGKEIALTVKINSYSKLKTLFLIGMERNLILFGKYAFRFSSQIRSPINKSLFETWGTLLALLSENDFSKLLKNKDKLLAKYEKLKEEPIFYRAISRDAWTKSSVDFRFKKILEIIQEAINA